jgi:hypothetical protein
MMAHGGDHVTGFTANCSRFMDDKLGIVVLANVMPVEGLEGIVRAIAGFYVPELAPTKTGAP